MSRYVPEHISVYEKLRDTNDENEPDTIEDVEVGLLDGRQRHEAAMDAEAQSDTQRGRLSWIRQRREPLPNPLHGFWKSSKPADWSTGRTRNRCSSCCFVLRGLAAVFIIFGIINFVLSTIDYVATLFPDHYGGSPSTYTYNLSRPADVIYHWPTDYTADIPPVACHSHNDYWRPVPVISAIQAGCTGVEADVWLLGDELYVGHSRASLTARRTFRTLYVEPLLRILDRQNPNTTFHPMLDVPRAGVFDTNSEQNLVLLIDFKTDGHELWRFVTEQLQPLRSRQYLTYFDGKQIVRGPLTVVVTGNAPFDKVIESFGYRDMFFDAPLPVMGTINTSRTDENLDPILQNIQAEHAFLAQYTNISKNKNGTDTPSFSALAIDPSIYTPSNSYYTSTSFLEVVGTPLPFLSSSQLNKIKAHIAGAHHQGLKARYWDIPAWPIGLRNYIWEVLVKEGIDYLNVDDLDGATKGDWQKGMRGTIWSRRVSWRS